MDLAQIVSTALSYQNINIFDYILDSIDKYHTRKVHSISDMKQRDDKHVHGMLWENFCKLWLLTDSNYIDVWHIKDIPLEIKSKLRIPNQDIGIDLVGHTPDGYIAIQCKYRKKGNKVTWASLSTFIALCVETGPWKNKLVMTNCKSITRKIATPSVHSLCYRTFFNTSRERWLKFSGNYIPRTINDIPKTPQKITHLNIINNEKTLDLQQELRNARLKRFT